MTLTRSFAAAIIDIVARDDKCRQRIDSQLSMFGRYAGAFRNSAYCIENWSQLKRCAPTPQQMENICYGIAEAAIEAINAVGLSKDKRTGTLATLKYAAEVGRNIGESGEHYAVVVVQKQGNSFERSVFDWWATLRTTDPLIYLNTTDFIADRNFAPFSRFAASPES